MFLNELKRKINAIQATAKITNVMKLVAVAKLRKNRDIFRYLDSFYETFYTTLATVKRYANLYFLQENLKNGNRTIWVCFFSSFGLCGSFNLNIAKALKKMIQPNDLVYVIGKKGKSMLNSQKISQHFFLNIDLEDKENNSDFFMVLAQNLFDVFFNDKQIKSIKLIYTRFINSLVFEPLIFPLIPFDAKIDSRFQKITNNKVFTLEPNEDRLFRFLLLKYFGIALYGAMLESKISENSARYNSMDKATENAYEIVQNYHLLLNKKRQAKITQEIIEIVMGTNAN